MSEIDREIERLEREIAADEEELTAVQVKAVREREEELRWFEGLTDMERVELFRGAPEVYRRAMDAIARRATTRLVGGDA